jgi:hypothetical protein
VTITQVFQVVTPIILVNQRMSDALAKIKVLEDRLGIPQDEREET